MPPVDRLDTEQLTRLFETAERWLALNREPVNAINVYPVPDGDTGTNMLLTLHASLEAARDARGSAVGPFMRSMARGALLGARGNSGVILSQMIRGLAEPLEHVEALDGCALRDALRSAASAAYDAVSDPVEGTMLTVMREAAEAATGVAERPTIDEVLDAAVAEAHASVERTPALLPRLAEAGVVDAGGLGVAVLLSGMRFAHRGEELPAPMETLTAAVKMSAVEHEGHGYCTEFVIVGRGLERDAMLRALGDAGGDSLLVVGDARALHVHLHVQDPGAALSIAAAAGELESVKVENMQAQHDTWAAGHGATREAEPAEQAEAPELGLVAVAQGPGIARAFRELGAKVVDGGPTSNPSAGELLEAVRTAGRVHTFVLPNDRNVVMAAEQAARQEPGRATVIPAHSIAAGFCAAFAYEPGGDPGEVAARMVGALDGVHCVEVTRAVRDAGADGVAVAEGDAIALVDGRLTARAETLEAAMLAGLARVAAGAELATVYLGADAEEGAAGAVQQAIGEAHPRLEVEVLRGGQPHYPYILGVE